MEICFAPKLAKMPWPTLSELNTLGFAVNVNAWPVAVTRAVTWPLAALIAVMEQQAAAGPAVAMTGEVFSKGASAAGVGAGAWGPLVIGPTIDLPSIETW
jgi:hypothetical protein